MAHRPSYLALHDSGELKRRAEDLWRLMESCDLCPRECGAARLEGDPGTCGATASLEIASHGPHRGEEPPLSGWNGSGAIFFTHCSLRCVFCFNAELSQGGEGRVVSVEDLARVMLELQGRGCHNVNLVSPTHYAPHVVLALDAAAGRGLEVPLVYNTCGWERPEILALLDGVVDVYLPDFKYVDPEQAAEYSPGADTYPEMTKAALLEMHRQVGVARPDSDGLVRRGLMIRHLVMPNDVAGSVRAVAWIAENLPRDTYLNLMSQYRPAHRAGEHPAISRPVSRAEYAAVVAAARDHGLTNVEVQGFPGF